MPTRINAVYDRKKVSCGGLGWRREEGALFCLLSMFLPGGTLSAWVNVFSSHH